MSKDILELIGRTSPPELDDLKNGPIREKSALHEALGSSEYWYQKYCALEKEIHDTGMRKQKIKRVNFIWKTGFICLFPTFIFAMYQAIQYRHKAEALETILAQTLQQTSQSQQR